MIDDRKSEIVWRARKEKYVAINKTVIVEIGKKTRKHNEAPLTRF